ncbi:hypothetical protein [Euzebya pacifica]|uniref:hypothetical protein n=1 Tax=Euzebya pacifica TaxID=1608957 RepID=UPI0013DFAFBB|nr:hypothetical protein [Euzebya pacifica]
MIDGAVLDALRSANTGRGWGSAPALLRHSVVWVPQSPYVVDGVQVVAGAPAPGPGGSVLTGRPIVNATLVDSTGEETGTFIGEGITAQITDGRVELDPVDSGELAGRIVGQLQFGEMSSAWAVPLSALLPGASGSCILTMQEGPVSGWEGVVPVSTTVLGDNQTEVLVGVPAQEGQVVINPREAPHTLVEACP